MRAICPFCKHDNIAIRGDGCCYCDHTGLIPVGEGRVLRTVEEALNHDPEISLHDLRINRAKGRPDNYKPW
jgi:hypothetical protein